MEQPKARLTLQQHQQAINEAIWIDASPHEWPTVDKMWLLCSALIDSVQMVDCLRSRLAAVEAERDAARAEVERLKGELEVEENNYPYPDFSCGTFAAQRGIELRPAGGPTYTTTIEHWQGLFGELKTVQGGQARAVEALEKILVGGNHLASALTGMFEDRLPPYGTDFNEARRAFAGSDEYDLWVCWAVIMRVRDSLSDPQPALDWLAQQRAEAAEAERRANTDVIRSLGPAFCDFFFDGPGDADYLAGVLAQQRSEAAAVAWNTAITLAHGCSDYGGGHTGENYDAFQHGISTVAAVLEAKRDGDDSLQMKVVESVGVTLRAGATGGADAK